MQKVEIYDTTLRDGTQGEAVSFTLLDKLRLAEKLDEFGVDFIEGGYPGSNPKDIAFFERVRKKKFQHARIVAFGSTRRKNLLPEEDQNLRRLAESGTDYVTIFGKSWDLHATEVLKVSREENLKMIRDSVSFLVGCGMHVFFDAEHFFDGFKNDSSYALATILSAAESGAERIVLCDTNGGTLPFEIEEIICKVKECCAVPLGIHCHNDSGLALANSLEAVRCGAFHVQGTMNGYGVRRGNSDLMSVIPILQLKMGYFCVPEEKLKSLTLLSRTVSELANLVPSSSQPFVGLSAFAHKGGVHIDAVAKNPLSYEHILPQAVGNERRILVSELSGKSAILQKFGSFDLAEQPALVKDILTMIGQLENEGYQFESAEGSFELMVRRAIGGYKKLFEVEGFRVIVEQRGKKIVSEATVKIKVGKEIEHTASEGNGPVNALDAALRKALLKFYPDLGAIKLTDYKVRILHPEKATAAVTRVLIESNDDKSVWGTIGLSENIIEASWQALLDSFEYKLLKDIETNYLQPEK